MLNKKDEKIFIDLDDEITFVVERIKNSEADRITLVAPEGAGIISSLISLKLLSKLVYKLGKSLVLVTMDESGQKFAETAGIPVVKRVAEVSEDMWLESESKLKKRGVYPILGQKATADDEIEEKREDKKDIEKPSNSESKEATLEEDTDEKETAQEETTPSDKEKVVLEETSDEEPSLADFGFAVDKDVAEQPAFLGEPTPIAMEEEPDPIVEKEEGEFISDFHPEEKLSESVLADNVEQKEEGDMRLLGKDMTGYRIEEPVLAKFNLSAVFASLKNIRLPKFSLKKSIPLVGFVLALVLVGGVYSYFVAPTAAIELSVKFDTVELEQEIRATQSVSDVDIENLKIPLMLQEAEESGSDSALATKTEIRGEKAKGKVTLVNKTESALELEAGTALTGAGYDFVLLANVTVDAADIFAGTLGREEVDIEAYDIGEEYNLSSNIEFSVEGYSTGALVGKNFSDFTGGTKEEVLVVSAEDREGLKSALEERLRESAKNKVKDQVGEGFIFNDDMINLEISNETYDVEVGAEADSFNLDMTIKAKAYIYAEEDLKTLGKQLLQDEVTSGLKLLEEESVFTGDFLRRDGEDAVINLKVTGVIAGDVTEESVKDLLVGKKSNEVDAILSGIEGVESYSAELGPDWLPNAFKHVPTIKGKISVDLKLETEETSSEGEIISDTEE